MSDILPLAQWREPNGRKVTREYTLMYATYSDPANTFTLFTETAPNSATRASFVEVSPERWRLMPNPTNAHALKVVRRGARTYVYPG